MNRHHHRTTDPCRPDWHPTLIGTQATRVLGDAGLAALRRVGVRLTDSEPMSWYSVGQDESALTQEFMARMLAVRRATVTEAARRLQQAGLITHNRGIITEEHVRLVG